MLSPGVKVAGAVLINDGGRLHPGVITNGTQGQVVDNAATLDQMVEPFGRRGNVGLTHVEGHMAAIIRARVKATGRHVHATAVLTREPCPDIPNGCERTLPKMLPFASTLTIYIKNPDGTLRHHKTYVGTGTGVKL
ncbi:DddA-like double-stranded DNA deaminase toxin [Longispora urticae]